MANIKFNIYYARSRQGPWTLANDTPIDSNNTGDYSYTISGLDSLVNYFIQVIPGNVEGEEFYPLVSQPVGPFGTGAKGIDLAGEGSYQAKTFAPKVKTSDILGQQFIFGANDESVLGNQFEIDAIITDDSLGNEFTTSITTGDSLGMQMEVGSINTTSNLANEFEVSIPVFEETFEGDGGIRAWNEDYWHRNEISPEENISWSDAQVNTTETVESFGTGW